MIKANDRKKRDLVENLLILKKVRARSIDDDMARVYQPGEEGRFKGSDKLQLLAMGSATTDLETEVDLSKNDKPDLSKMKGKELDEYALENYDLDLSRTRTLKDKIKQIKAAAVQG